MEVNSYLHNVRLENSLPPPLPFPHFSLLSLPCSAEFSLLLPPSFSPVSLCLYPCPLISRVPPLCRMLLNIFCMCPPLFFTSHFMWSPASGQLTGCCRAFPATRAAGKRPVWCAISDNSLHLDWFLHRFSCSTEALLIPMFLPSFLFYSIPHSSSPRSPLLLQYALLFSILLRFLHGVETPFHQGTGGDMLALLCMVLIFNSPPATSFIILSLFFFNLFLSLCFFSLKVFSACSCLDVGVAVRSFGMVFFECHIFTVLPV